MENIQKYNYNTQIYHTLQINILQSLKNTDKITKLWQISALQKVFQRRFCNSGLNCTTTPVVNFKARLGFNQHDPIMTQ